MVLDEGAECAALNWPLIEPLLDSTARENPGTVAVVRRDADDKFLTSLFMLIGAAEVRTALGGDAESQACGAGTISAPAPFQLILLFPSLLSCPSLPSQLAKMSQRVFGLNAAHMKNRRYKGQVSCSSFTSLKLLCDDSIALLYETNLTALARCLSHDAKGVTLCPCL
jgi:hypothetical protein